MLPRQPSSPGPTGGTGVGWAIVRKAHLMSAHTIPTSARPQWQPSRPQHGVISRLAHFPGEARVDARESPHSARGSSSWKPWFWPRLLTRSSEGDACYPGILPCVFSLLLPNTLRKESTCKVNGGSVIYRACLEACLPATCVNTAQSVTPGGDTGSSSQFPEEKGHPQLM